jgi:hypothetical protein
MFYISNTHLKAVKETVNLIRYYPGFFEQDSILHFQKLIESVLKKTGK